MSTKVGIYILLPLWCDVLWMYICNVIVYTDFVNRNGKSVSQMTMIIYPVVIVLIPSFFRVYAVYKSLWSLLWSHWWRVVAKKAATEARVPSGYVEVITVSSLTWLTVTEYLCHKWPRLCSACRNHNPVLSSYMTFYRICDRSKTKSATSGAGTAYHFGAHYISIGFVCIHL